MANSLIVRDGSYMHKTDVEETGENKTEERFQQVKFYCKLHLLKFPFRTTIKHRTIGSKTWVKLARPHTVAIQFSSAFGIHLTIGQQHLEEHRFPTRFKG